MTVNNTQDRYLGKPVVEFRMGDTIADRDSVRTHVYRLAQDYDSSESQRELFDAFLAQVDAAAIEALIIGAWSEAHDTSPQAYLDALIERRAELPALRALFVGDMTYEDCEISWIIQTGYNALLDAFPQLRSLRIRGSSGLALEAFSHAALEEPALRRLELWLGDDNYGFDGDVWTYARMLDAIDASRLDYLGLRDAQISDDLAKHLAAQPWLGKLKTLDLSMGTIGDAGAQALCESPYPGTLETLDLSHHYIGAEWQAKLRALPCKVVLDDPQDEDDGERYVAVAE